jgi:hypothetical protein
MIFGILGMKFLLLVTWFVSGQPPSSYQATFNSAEACEVARKAVLADGQRFKDEQYQKPFAFTGDQKMSALASLGAPKVTAVCAAQ